MRRCGAAAGGPAPVRQHHPNPYRRVMESRAPETVDELAERIAGLSALPPIERARTARALVDEAKRILSAVADAAVEEETRTRSYEEVARDLGRSVASVNKAVSRHRRRSATSQPNQ